MAPDAIGRVHAADMVVVDDRPWLGEPGLEVESVETRLPEELLLRYAASAFRHIDDPRAAALREACRSRQTHLLDLPTEDLDGGVTVRHGKHRVRVADERPGAGGAGGLSVEIDGNFAGLIAFRRGSRPAAAPALRKLAETLPGGLVLVSDRPQAEAAALGAALGVNRVRGGLDAEGKARFLQDCRASGRRPAFVGEPGRDNRAAAESHVAVAVVADFDPDADASLWPVQTLGLRIDRLELLWDAAREHDRRARLDHTYIVVPNLFCVAGGLIFGFTGLASVLISNLGTYGVYARASGDLRGLPRSDRWRKGPPRGATEPVTSGSMSPGRGG
jgi:cation transport ATPase